MSSRVLRALIASGALFAAAGAAQASIVTDPLGDFLPSYTGPQGADLDVLSAEVVLDTTAGTFSFSGTMAGAVGSTVGGFYVFGLDRGEGTERFVSGSPSIGAGVRFDMVVILRPDGSGTVSDIVGGVTTQLAPGSALISGDSISSIPLPLSLFPTRGLDLEAYTWNLWPRIAGVTGNASVPDFAPDGSNAGVTVVPAPAGGAMLALAGLAAARRRRAR